LSGSYGRPVLGTNGAGVLDKGVAISVYKDKTRILNEFYRALGIPISEVPKSELEKYGDVAGVNINGRAMVDCYLAPEERAAVAAHEAGHSLLHSNDQRLAQLYAIKLLAEARDCASGPIEYAFFERALQSALRSAKYFGIDIGNYRKAA